MKDPDCDSCVVGLKGVLVPFPGPCNPPAPPSPSHPAWARRAAAIPAASPLFLGPPCSGFFWSSFTPASWFVFLSRACSGLVCPLNFRHNPVGKSSLFWLPPASSFRPLA